MSLCQALGGHNHGPAPEDLATEADGVKAATCPISLSQERGKAVGRPQPPWHADPPHPAFGHASPNSKAVSSPAAVWDTHKYIKERGLKLVLNDFILQVLLNAILGLKGR